MQEHAAGTRQSHVVPVSREQMFEYFDRWVHFLWHGVPNANIGQSLNPTLKMPLLLLQILYSPKRTSRKGLLLLLQVSGVFYTWQERNERLGLTITS